MDYRDLQDLIDQSRDSRDYFFSLPSRTQMQLWRHDSLVTNRRELLHYADYFSRVSQKEDSFHQKEFLS